MRSRLVFRIQDTKAMRADFAHFRGNGYRCKLRRHQIEVNLMSNLYSGGHLKVNTSPSRVFRRGTHG